MTVGINEFKNIYDSLNKKLFVVGLYCKSTVAYIVYAHMLLRLC